MTHGYMTQEFMTHTKNVPEPPGLMGVHRYIETPQINIDRMFHIFECDMYIQASTGMFITLQVYWLGVESNFMKAPSKWHSQMCVRA